MSEELFQLPNQADLSNPIVCAIGAAKVYPYEIEVLCERELIGLVDEKWSAAN